MRLLRGKRAFGCGHLEVFMIMVDWTAMQSDATGTSSTLPAMDKSSNETMAVCNHGLISSATGWLVMLDRSSMLDLVI